MKRLIIFFICSLFICMISCKKEYISLQEEDNTGKVPVNISMGFDHDDLITTSYIPMSKAISEEAVKVKIRNAFNIIVLKKNGTDWVIEELIKYEKNEPNLSYFSDLVIGTGNELNDFNFLLRPGTYRIVVFTGAYSTLFNPLLKAGDIIDSINAPYAITYITGDLRYPNSGLDYVPEEIFAGYSDEFEVKKTEDLHSDPTLNVSIDLYRKVTKYRALLKDIITDGGNEINNTLQKNIYLNMKAVDGDEFVSGLDIWGRPWYNTNNRRTAFYYCTNTSPESRTATDLQKYFVSVHGTTVYGPYLFTDPDRDVRIKIDSVYATYQDRGDIYLYADEDIENIVIRHNDINGIIFELGDIEGIYWDSYNQPNPTKSLHLVTDEFNKPKSIDGLFSDFYEFN